MGPSVTFWRIVLWAKRWKPGTPSRRRPAGGQLLALLGQRLAVDADRAGLERLQPVDGAAEGRLARSGRPENDDDLTLADGQVDVLEDVEVTEVLVDRRDVHHRRSARGRGRTVRRGRRGTVRVLPRVLRASLIGATYRSAPFARVTSAPLAPNCEETMRATCGYAGARLACGAVPCGWAGVEGYGPA